MFHKFKSNFRLLDSKVKLEYLSYSNIPEQFSVCKEFLFICKTIGWSLKRKYKLGRVLDKQ